MSGVAAMRKAQTFIEEALRCKECGKLRTERVTEWRTRGTGRSGESVGTALKFQHRTDATHCSCPPAAPMVNPSIRSIPYTQPTGRKWDCLSCGAGVDAMIDACLFCGYAREKCTSCDGEGVLDVGAPATIGAMPCGCDDGYCYPPVERATSEDPNDCAGCGARPAPKDDDGNPMYPEYQRQGEPPVGLCGYCARESGVRV